MSLLELLEAAARSGPQAIEQVLADVELPHVDGRNVTFLFRGEAQAVSLHHWVHGLPGELPFRRLGRSDLWGLQLDLPRGSRMEYKIGVMSRGHGQHVRDPLNRQTARDPFGANSVVYGDGYAPPEWTVEDPEARKGTVEDRHVDSPVFGDWRPIKVYRPARFRETRRYPLLVVHDGFDYLDFASFKETLDNLIHRLELPPLVAVTMTVMLSLAARPPESVTDAVMVWVPMLNVSVETLAPVPIESSRLEVQSRVAEMSPSSSSKADAWNVTVAPALELEPSGGAEIATVGEVPPSFIPR